MSQLSQPSTIDLRVVSSRPAPAGRRLTRTVQECLDELGFALQRSLDPYAQLQQFSEALSGIVPWDGLHFSNELEGVEHQIGILAAHGAEYRLSIDEVYLGELRLARRARFSEKELELLERFLCVLIYPLRNAMLYQRALASALKDGLTGLGNRTAFDQALDREFQLARRHHRPLSLLVVDIDHFKQINDRLGHSAGDTVLRTVAQRLGDIARRTDMVFRYGGEEFVFLLSNTDQDGAKLLAERLRGAVEECPCECQNESVHITVSVGLTSLADDVESAGRLFDQADAALYDAKAGGRNRVCTAF
ncbi:MAG: GGDEF domain-containing protein [Gammaproteobacteria bacterium]|nr:GGDEF domain-containing protein [Gammaproteobacteria bacterium]